MGLLRHFATKVDKIEVVPNVEIVKDTCPSGTRIPGVVFQTKMLDGENTYQWRLKATGMGRITTKLLLSGLQAVEKEAHSIKLKSNNKGIKNIAQNFGLVIRA